MNNEDKPVYFTYFDEEIGLCENIDLYCDGDIIWLMDDLLKRNIPFICTSVKPKE